MLPNEISDLSTVDSKFQAFYTKVGDGEVYTIDSELKQPDVEGLKSTNVSLKNEKSEIKNELQSVKQTLEALQAQSQEEKLLEKEEYSTLLTEKEKTFSAELTTAQTELSDLKRELINSEVAALAQEIAGDNGALIAPHLAGLEYSDGIQYPDNQTREDFIDKFKNDPLFAPLTSTQNASGSGANSSGGSTQHTNEANLEAYFDPNSASYSPSKQYEVQQENPDIYTRLENKFQLNDPYNSLQHTTVKTTMGRQ